MRQCSDGGLNAKHDRCCRAKAEGYEDTGEIGLREEYGVDGILASGHRHTHIGRGMVCPMKSPQPRDLVVQAVVPVLREGVGNAENEDAPEEGDPVEDIVLAWKQDGQHRQAEPGKERSEDELGDSEAGKIERLLISVPFVAVEAERKLDDTENDDEEHESVTMR